MRYLTAITLLNELLGGVNKACYNNHCCSLKNIYILGAFTEKPYSKTLERNVVYTSIITLSHATSHDIK